MPDGVMTVALLVDDVPIVGFRREGEQLLLTAQLFDAENEHVVQVIDNELVYSIKPWDIELESTRLTIRNAPRDIFVTIEFTAPSLVEIGRGHFCCNGIEFKVFPDHVETDRSHMSDVETTGYFVGIAFGDPPPGPIALVMPSTRKPHPHFKRPVRTLTSAAQ